MHCKHFIRTRQNYKKFLELLKFKLEYNEKINYKREYLMASTIELKKLLFCLLEALDITDPEKVKHIIKISYISNKLLTYLNIDQKESLILGSMYINLLNIKESTFTEENKLLEHNTKGFEDLLHEIKTHHQDLLNLLMDTSKEILDHILKNGSLDKGITNPIFSNLS